MNDITATIPVRPRRLKPGDTIGIVAPASPFDQGDFDAGCALLQELGFKLRTADGLFARQGYLCGSDRQRAAQLHQVFADDAVHAVLCVRGGYGVLRILEALDFDLIGSHPKALIGFSDITALHQALFQKFGWVSFHGPMLSTMATADDMTLDAWRAALMGEAAVTLTSVGTDPVVFSGVARGVVQGGNLATLCHLVGTAFHPRFEGAILVLEETREPLYRIDRMLTQMKLAGVLSRTVWRGPGGFRRMRCRGRSPAAGARGF